MFKMKVIQAGGAVQVADAVALAFARGKDNRLKRQWNASCRFIWSNWSIELSLGSWEDEEEEEKEEEEESVEAMLWGASKLWGIKVPCDNLSTTLECNSSMYLTASLMMVTLGTLRCEGTEETEGMSCLSRRYSCNCCFRRRMYFWRSLLRLTLFLQTSELSGWLSICVWLLFLSLRACDLVEWRWQQLLLLLLLSDCMVMFQGREWNWRQKEREKEEKKAKAQGLLF